VAYLSVANESLSIMSNRSSSKSSLPTSSPREVPARHAVADVGSAVLPGDILFVQGSHFRVIGANGGFMGHVLLVVGAPQPVQLGTSLATALEPVWPAGETCIWRVHTIESTRSSSGLHQAEMLLHVKKDDESLRIVGELSMDHDDLSKVDSEAVQVWQSPPYLRQRVKPELVREILDEMNVHNAGWSLATAARALLMSGKRCDDNIQRSSVVNVAKSCWQTKPICTSVVIVFWQRFLCKFEPGTRGAAALIKKWMPLKADCTLPSTLQAVLRDCGWAIIEDFGHDIYLL